MLEKLGKHKAGKGCFYIKSLDDVNVNVLEKIVQRNMELLKKKYPDKKYFFTGIKKPAFACKLRRAKSGRLDSNQRPLAPHASALPGCATSRMIQPYSGGKFTP